MNLQQTILNECREEVAKEYGYDSWQEVEQSTRWSHKDDLHEEADLLAMDRQANFFRDLSKEGWEFDSTEPVEWKKDGSYKTELELYNIWREGK